MTTVLSQPASAAEPYHQFDIESELSQLAEVIATEDHFGEPAELDALRWSAGQVRRLLARYQRLCVMGGLACDDCTAPLAGFSPDLHQLGRIRFRADLCMPCYRLRCAAHSVGVL